MLVAVEMLPELRNESFPSPLPVLKAPSYGSGLFPQRSEISIPRSLVAGREERWEQLGARCLHGELRGWEGAALITIKTLRSAVCNQIFSPAAVECLL